MLFSYLANDISIVGSRANEAGQTEGDRRIVFQMLFSYFANDIFLLCKRYCPTSQMILSSRGAAQMDRAKRRETKELFSKCYFSTFQTIFSYFANDININHKCYFFKHCPRLFLPINDYLRRIGGFFPR